MRWKNADYSGWGRAIVAHGEIARPERMSALDSLLSDAMVPAIGMLRSYGDAALNSAGRVIDMTRLDRMLSFDPAIWKPRRAPGSAISPPPSRRAAGCRP